MYWRWRLILRISAMSSTSPCFRSRSRRPSEWVFPRNWADIVTITVAVIIVTGILGNVIGEHVFRIFRIDEPIAKGVALGSASHAIGTAKAMELGEIEGAMSSLSIAVAGLLTVLGASVFAGLW